MKMTWHQCVTNMRKDLRGMIVAALENEDAECAQDAMYAYSAVSTWFEQIHKHGVDESTIDSESDTEADAESNPILRAITEAAKRHAHQQKKGRHSIMRALLKGLGNGLRPDAIESGVDNMGRVGRKNKYTCDGCKRHIVTIDKDDGVSAFMIPCLSPDPECRGLMTSSLYQGVPEDEAPDFEWRKPLEAHIPLLSEALQGHVQRRGLILYPAGDPEALPHKMQLE